MKRNSWIWTIIVLVIVVVAGFFVFRGYSPMQMQNQNQNQNSSTPIATTTVNIQNFAFSPQNIVVKSSDTVTWTNNDTVNHTVTADDNSWTSPTLSPGQKYQHTFTDKETYKYHCRIHPYMTASVVVQ